MKPSTHYAKNGSLHIAYQVVGDGPVDLLYIPGWVSNIDMMWVDTKIADFLRYLTHFTRVIVFDKRGTGLSDRVSPLCTLEERMTDILSVMDAADSKECVLFGHSEGGSIACLFAATYPERTVSVVTFGVFAKRAYSEDYPWAPTAAKRQEFYDSIQNDWGNGQQMGLEGIMPSMAHDPHYYTLFASYLRLGASPGDALALAKMNTDTDITGLLPSISAPVLVLHRVDDPEVVIEEAQYLAARILHARLVELPGNDHCFWVGDTHSVLVEIAFFITGVRPNTVKPPALPFVPNPKINLERVMNEHFKVPLHLEGYATLCGRSVSAFKRDFYAAFGTTPFKWLKTARLHYASVLLADSDLNINQICFECGFVNVSHFIRVFKELYGVPPLQYRAMPHLN